MLHLAEGFLAEGHEVDVVVSRSQGAYAGQLPSGATLIGLKKSGGLRGRWLAFRASAISQWRALAKPVLFTRKAALQLRYLPDLVRYMRAAKPAALIAGYPYCNLIALWARTLARVPTRVIVTEHCAVSRTIADKARKGPQWRALPALLGSAYELADAVVAVSQGVAEDLVATLGLPRQRITTIYNPVVTPKLGVLAGEAPPHAWLGEDTGWPVIVGAGRLVASKNFPLLLKAFAKLRERRPARLLILGEGPERGRLEALAHDLALTDCVALPGYVANPYAAFSRAALFVLSSDHEGLPTVLIEALACGCPVVSTDCPSGPAEILEYGRYGELVPVDDAGALADAMERALRSPLSAVQLRRRGMEFGLEAGVRRYRELLGPGDRPAEGGDAVPASIAGDAR